jgi:plasmid stabilization system protein ParE
MVGKISLFGRKRLGDLLGNRDEVGQAKKEELVKLNEALDKEAPEQKEANAAVVKFLRNDPVDKVSVLEEAEALAHLVGDMGVSKGDVGKSLGRDNAWVSMRLGLNKASSDIKALAKDGFVEDMRTLHELRMFEKRSPSAAERLIKRIRNNQVPGSYRKTIAEMRTKSSDGKRRKAKRKPHRISRIEKADGRLLVHVINAKRPVEFEMTPEVMVRFMAEVAYE